MGYRENRDWANRHHAQIKKQLLAWNAKHNLTGVNAIVASPTLDVTRGTDYVLKAGENVLIGARVRRNTKQQYFDWDFTIRQDNGTGGPTELDKFLTGEFASHYGVFMSDQDDNIIHGKLLDMALLRHRLLTNDDLLQKVYDSQLVPRDSPMQRFVCVEYGDHPGIILDSF